MNVTIFNGFFPKANASSVTGGFGSGGSVFTVILLALVCCCLIAVLLYISASIKKYRRFKALFKRFSKTFSYAGYGLLTVVIIGLPVYLAYTTYTVASENKEASWEVLKWVGYIFLAYIGLTLIGFATKKRIWKRIYKYHKTEKDYKEAFEQLPGVYKT